ncbi:MAG: dihydrofolate reductase [Nanoarchaeota archaeon]
MTTYTIIAALDEDYVIGHQGRIPWHIRDDLKRFKRLTMGHAIIMGRNTYDSIGRPLCGRRNIVITSRRLEADVMVAGSIDEAISLANAEEKAFFIGGEQVYAAVLDIASIMELTHVHGNYPADAYFPRFDPAKWHEAWREDHDSHHFCRYERRT